MTSINTELKNIVHVNENKVSKISYYNGILMGLFLSADMIIKFTTALIPVEGLLPLIYISIFLLGLIINGFKLNKSYFYVYIIITLLFGISLMRVDENFYTLQYFIYFSAFYFASGILQFSTSIINVFKTINLINVIYASYLFFIIIPAFSKGELLMDYTMNLSYTSLIGVSAFLLTFTLFNYKKSKLFLIINGLCVLVELYFMFFVSMNRGSLVALAILLSILLLRKLKNPISRILYIGLFVSVGYLIYNNLLAIVTYLYDLTLRYNLPSTFIQKSLWKLQYEDFSSGRFDLYKNAYESFAKSPFWGEGIGLFPTNNNGQYPHNLFLDILSSLGLFATVIVFLFVLYTSLLLLKVRTTNYSVLATFIFVLAIPELIFSLTLWMSPFFWALVVLILINPTLREQKERTIA